MHVINSLFTELGVEFKFCGHRQISRRRHVLTKLSMLTILSALIVLEQGNVPWFLQILGQLTSISTELVVELCNLPKKTVVGPHIPVLANLCEGFHGCHVAAKHEVGQDARR